MWKFCSKIAIKTPKQLNWPHFSVFIVNFEQISCIALMFPLLNTGQEVTSNSDDSITTDLVELGISLFKANLCQYSYTMFHSSVLRESVGKT